MTFGPKKGCSGEAGHGSREETTAMKKEEDEGEPLA